MSAFDDLTYAITNKANNVLKRSCSPLFTYLNLNNFWFYKVTLSGYFTFFGTHIAACEYFSAKKIYQDFFYYRHPKFFQSGVALQKSIPDQEFLKATGELFNLHHSLLILEKTRDGIEGFGFSSSTPDEIQLVRMMNELPMLRLFARHFRSEHKALFSLAEEQKIDLKRLIGPTFDTPPNPVEKQSSQKQSLLKKMGFDFLEYLSTNEIQIIKRLLDGYSASQIGDQIFRSKRTVEHALEKIKDKMGCDSKTELVQKARHLENLGFLDRM